MDLGTVGGWVVLVHALAGVLLLGALVGRWMLLGMAARAADLASMRTIAAAAAPFERIAVLGSLAVLGLGLAAAVVQGRPVLGPFQGGHVDWLFVALILFLSIVPIVPFVFIPRGRVFEAAMRDAVERGEVTESLRAAWADPVVRAAHVYELTVVTVVLVLMLAKPF
jgi:hypothetical protein